MSHQWVVEALKEIREHAFQNYYVSLAEKLDDVIMAAMDEITSRERALPDDIKRLGEDPNVDRSPA